ncbi:hypothetical protein [Clostridium celatum]|uniref:hypothetical protein n=1 Tax=Clostridium celatum TaxID=36834 RepID=UPI00319E1612
MKEKDLNNEDEILTGQSDIDNVNLTPEGEVWNKEAALKENLTEQLGRTNKRIKANLNRIKDELGLDKINSVIAELIEIYEKRPPENNGIDIKSDLLVLNKSKDAIENIIKAINSKTSQFEKEVKGSAAHIQQQIDLTIKSFMDTLNEINDRFEENIKEQENINSSLSAELQDALDDIEVHKNANNELIKKIEKKETEIDGLKSEKTRIEAEAANAIQDIVTLKNTINDLHEVKEKNKKLRNDLSEKEEEIRGLEHNLFLKESFIANLTNENEILTQNNVDLKDKLRSKEEKINTIKEENRNVVSELTLKHKEELIDMKEKIKEEVEKKYEDKINKLKDEIYDLKKTLETIDKK